MNYWTELSVEFANQRDYLDQLFKIYPTIPEGIRDIDQDKWEIIEKHFDEGNKFQLITNLLTMPIFPIKDSYVAYLKRDPSAVARNPKTLKRLYGRLKEMGLNEIFKQCTKPKETNRQIGPLFKRWLAQGTLGFDLLNLDQFSNTSDDSILMGSDRELKYFAHNELRYSGEKGVDFIARVSNKYIAGEAKFLTDFGGHQSTQFDDAKNLLYDNSINAVKIAVLDGVLYIKGNNRMHKFLEEHDYHNIFSALILREFLHSI